jgi:hypothetical protein
MRPLKDYKIEYLDSSETKLYDTGTIVGDSSEPMVEIIPSPYPAQYIKITCESCD